MAKEEVISLDQVAKEGVEDEYGDYAIYQRLAKTHATRKRARPRKLADVFEKLSQTEYVHYEFWKKYSPRTEAKVSKFKLYAILIIEAVLGATFAIKFLERHEKKSIKQYKAIEKRIPSEDRARFEQMVREEQEHEVQLADQVQGSVLKYMSFIVLGLADAIVEVSGIHAGSLGIYNSTELTGLAGIIAGASASMAMASAAYAQAKQGFQGSASMSAVITGVSYFLNAVLLATPYFITKVAWEAMSVSLSFAIIVLACTSYYNSIVSGSNFWRDFLELAGIMLLATVALLFFGQAMRLEFGIKI